MVPGPSLGFRLVAGLMGGLMRLLRWRVAVSGLENVPPTGGAVVAWHHNSYLDMVAIGVTIFRRCGRPVRLLAAGRWFRVPVLGWMLRGIGAVAVERGSAESRAAAYERAVDAAASGHIVMLAPETTIQRDLEVGELRTGAARVAVSARVPLLAAVAWGPERVWTAGRLPRPTAAYRLPVAVGFSSAWTPPADADAVDVTDTLRARMVETLERARRLRR